MDYIFIDIETAPFEIKDDFIIKYLMDKKLTNDSRSLDPNYSKIILIGIKFNDESIFFEGEEKEILNNFWGFIKDKNFVIITHNGYGFDIPFIIVRSVINDIKITRSINLNHWNMLNSNHIDTMLIFSQNVFTNSALKILAKLNNIDFESDNLDGRDIERFYKENKFDLIKEKCKKDIEILEKLFNLKCKSYLESLRR
jgi:DNA polymerase elongation subunit (family B)